MVEPSSSVCIVSLCQLICSSLAIYQAFLFIDTLIFKTSSFSSLPVDLFCIFCFSSCSFPSMELFIFFFLPCLFHFFLRVFPTFLL